MSIIDLFSQKNYQAIINLASNQSVDSQLDTHSKRLVAVSYYYLQNFERSVEYCVELYPHLNSDPDFLSFYGSCLRKHGDLGSADDLYKSALLLHPESLTLKNNYANLLIDLSRYEEAKSLLNSALSADPGYEDALSNLSRLNFLESSQSGSTSSSNTAHSSSFDQYDPLAASFSVDEVKRSFTDKLPASSQDHSLELQGSLPVQSLKLEQHERIKLIRTNISLDPLMALDDLRILFNEVGPRGELYVLAGDIYLKLKLFGDAETAFLTALAHSINDPAVYINLANLSHLRGDELLAFKWLEIISSTTPDFPQLSQVSKLLFPNGKPSSSRSPFQYNPEQACQGNFLK